LARLGLRQRFEPRHDAVQNGQDPDGPENPFMPDQGLPYQNNANGEKDDCHDFVKSRRRIALLLFHFRTSTTKGTKDREGLFDDLIGPDLAHFFLCDLHAIKERN